MFSAENYVSGDASNFRATLDEQLKDGGYAVDKEVDKDTIYDCIEVKGDRRIREIKTTYNVNKREGKDGKPMSNGLICITESIMSPEFNINAYNKLSEKDAELASTLKLHERNAVMSTISDFIH